MKTIMIKEREKKKETPDQTHIFHFEILQSEK